MLAQWAMFGAGLFLLLLSSNMITISLVKLSRFLRMNEFVTGFILMAIVTSIPEIAVSVTSSLSGESQIALGNVLGANIMDMTFVLGVVSLVGRNIRVNNILAQDIFEMSAVVVMLLVLSIAGGGLSRIDGAILITTFIAYAWNLYRKGRRTRKRLEDGISPADAIASTALFISFTFILFLSAEMVVMNAKHIGLALGMPEILIGLVILSMGTTLPELFFESVSTANRHAELSLGDLVGSVVTNSTLVLGMAAIISPIKVDIGVVASSFGFLVLAAFLFFVFSESDRKITWKEGLTLLLLYIVFIIVEMQAKGVI